MHTNSVVFYYKRSSIFAFRILADKILFRNRIHCQKFWSIILTTRSKGYGSLRTRSKGWRSWLTASKELACKACSGKKARLLQPDVPERRG